MFLAPPWPDIYCADEARRHGFPEAEAEYAHLDATYRALGYEVRLLPRASVAERADFVLQAIHRRLRRDRLVAAALAVDTNAALSQVHSQAPFGVITR